VSAIVKFPAPSELLFPAADEKTNTSPKPRAEFNLPDPICESELRWRKVAAPKIGMIEMFVFVLLLVASIVSVISCFVELAHLLDSDAIGHVAAKALQGGG
jgi:hypothetical protein